MQLDGGPSPFHTDTVAMGRLSQLLRRARDVDEAGKRLVEAGDVGERESLL